MVSPTRQREVHTGVSIFHCFGIAPKPHFSCHVPGARPAKYLSLARRVNQDRCRANEFTPRIRTMHSLFLILLTWRPFEAMLPLY